MTYFTRIEGAYAPGIPASRVQPNKICKLINFLSQLLHMILSYITSIQCVYELKISNKEGRIPALLWRRWRLYPELLILLIHYSSILRPTLNIILYIFGNDYSKHNEYNTDDDKTSTA